MTENDVYCTADGGFSKMWNIGGSFKKFDELVIRRQQCYCIENSGWEMMGQIMYDIYFVPWLKFIYFNRFWTFEQEELSKALSKSQPYVSIHQLSSTKKLPSLWKMPKDGSVPTVFSFCSSNNLCWTWKKIFIRLKTKIFCNYQLWAEGVYVTTHTRFHRLSQNRNMHFI